MPAIPPPLLSALNESADPLRRAARLHELADAHQSAGQPIQARLLRLVAQTEALLVDPNSEAEDDPAWDQESWWQLAGTRDREERATLIETIFHEWASPQFGHNADVLLNVADSERQAPSLPEDDIDRILKEANTAQLAVIDATFDFEARLADVYARAGIPRPQAGPVAALPESCQAALDEPEEEAASAPSTAVRDLVAFSAKLCGAGVVLAVPVLLVTLPQASWQLKVGAALALILLVLGWVVWQLCRRPLVIRGPQR